MVQAWVVRAGRDDEYEDVAFAHDVVVVDWGRVGNLSAHTSREQIGRLAKRAYPEVSARTQLLYAAQLYAFRTVMQVGDLVVLLRANAPQVAIGEVTGSYAYRPDLPAHHARQVTWLRQAVRRSEIGADLLDPPALSVVYRITKSGVLAPLRQAVGQQDVSPLSAEPTPSPEVDAPMTSLAYAGLSRNLNYARNLTTAGSHLQQLGVALFEVTDVYRAAWVQAVAALDHWVRQEIQERMLRLVTKPDTAKPDRYQKFQLPLGAIEDIHAGKLSLRDALDAELRLAFGHKTFQDPSDIRQGFGHVADVADLWNRVAKVISERAGTKGSYTGNAVQQRLREIVSRRNKIAHEYDEDPANPPQKRDIGAADTMRTIEMIDQVAAAILELLDQS